mgnify:FL=1
MALPQPDLNFWAVLVAALCNMVLGFSWYGFLFGKAWMKEMGIDKLSKKETATMKEKDKKSMWMAAGAALLTTYVMSHFVDYLEAATVSEGLQLGFWLWLGFVAPIMLGIVLWEGKSWKLYAINVSYWLVVLLIMGSILAVWQ